MKIIITPLDVKYGGILSAGAASLDKDFKVWNPRYKAVFDMLHEEKPDVLITDIRFVDASLIKAIDEYDTEVVLFGSGVPGGLNPKVVCAPGDASPMIRGHLDSADHKTVYIKDFANVVDFWGGEAEDNLTTQVGRITNLELDQHHDRNLMTLATVCRNFQVKIVGPQRVPFPQYLGQMPQSSYSSFMKSCDILLDFNGVDLLNAAANEVFCISSAPNLLFPSFENEDQAVQLVQDFLDKPQARNKKARKARKSVLENDTCYHRLSAIIEALGDQELASSIKQKVDELCAEE